MKIIFMGTPDFAVPCLDILVQNGYPIVAVVTAPDKPAGRGQKLSQSAVKKYALTHNLPVLQPEKLKDPQFLSALKHLQADLQVVVAFRMLPAAVFTMPPLGCINVHASLLPAYRGAAPINWAIINGETQTGVTTFYIEQEIDAGYMVYQESTPIAPHETAGELHNRLMMLGAQTLLKTVQAIAAGNAPKLTQPAIGDLPKAPKIFTQTCHITWQQPAQKIYNLIRGLSPYPAAFSRLNGLILKIFGSQLTNIPAQHLPPGTLLTDGKTYLNVAAGDYCLQITQLQLEGKKAMPADEFLRGHAHLVSGGKMLE